MKRFLLIAALLALPVLAQAQTEGLFHELDCGSITNPSADRVFCLQKSTVNGRTAGHIYSNLNGIWTDITGGTSGGVALSLAQFAATTSLELKGVISDETGSGALVFANTPTLVTPVLGAATGTSVVLSADAKARHLVGNGVAPAVTNTSSNSCGTTAATIDGTDAAGKVTVGATSGTSCTVTFVAAYAKAPACAASNETTAALVRATSTVSAVVLAGSFTAADVLAYNCVGY